MIKTCYLKVEVGYEMSRDECEEMMRECDASWDDYEDEEEAFTEMVEYKLSCGLGATAVVLGTEEE